MNDFWDVLCRANHLLKFFRKIQYHSTVLFFGSGGVQNSDMGPNAFSVSSEPILKLDNFSHNLLIFEIS